MKLKLSESAIANLYPTGKKALRRTFIDTLQRDVAEGELVEVASVEHAAHLVLCGLMDLAEPGAGQGLVAQLEKQRGTHLAAAGKHQLELDADDSLAEDRRAHLRRQLESEHGYCASFDAAIARCGGGRAPKIKATEKE